MGDPADPQRRARQIQAFREECVVLAREGVFEPTPEQRKAIDAYHSRLLASLARQFDIDLSDSQHALSLGRRLTTLVAAVALSAAALLALRRYWGYLAGPAQVAVAIVLPAAALLALDWSARAPRRRRLTSVLGLVAFASIVANVEILGTLFAFAPSPVALLFYGVVAVALAYSHANRVLLVAGVCCLAVFAMSVPVAWSGAWWDGALQRPETAIAVGLACLAVSSVGDARAVFTAWWRGLGCALVGLAFILLSNDGTRTWLPSADERPVEVAYTISAFVAGLSMIVIGARRRWAETSICGAVLVLVVLMARYFEWWTAYVPQWLFFLAVGAVAVAAGVVIGRYRQSGGEVT